MRNFYDCFSDYHAMGGVGPPGVGTPLNSPEGNYLPMDLISQVEICTKVFTSD